jgi:phosphoenolpyruvate carboxykinase (ATP)
MLNRETALGYLNSLPHVFVFDGYANWHAGSRIKVRVITERAYHALFMSNMLIRPTPAELDDFGEPEFVIFNAGAQRRLPLPPDPKSP